MLNSYEDTPKHLDRRATRQRAFRLMEEAASGQPLSGIDEQETTIMAVSDGFKGSIFDWGLESTSMDDTESVQTSSLLDDCSDGDNDDAPTTRISSWNSRNGKSLEGALDDVIEYNNASDGDESRSVSKTRLPPTTAGPLLVCFTSGVFLIMAFIFVTGGDPSLNSSLLRVHGGQPVGNISGITDAEDNHVVKEKSGMDGITQQTTHEEEELDLANFCDECQWKNAPFNCKKRVSWAMTTYNITETQAKIANLKQCTPTDDSGIIDTEDNHVVKEEGGMDGITQHTTHEEEELDLANFCDECQWKTSTFNCKKRISWLMKTYNITEIQAKTANLQDCLAPTDDSVEP